MMIKGQSMQYYGAAAKKGADAEGRWLQAKRAAVASSQEVLKKSGAGGSAGTSVGAEAWHMYVDTKSPEFRGLMTSQTDMARGLERVSEVASDGSSPLFFNCFQDNDIFKEGRDHVFVTPLPIFRLFGK